MNKELTKFLKELKKKGTKERAEGEKKYMKSPYKFYGVLSADSHKVAKDFYILNKEISKTELIQIIKELWNSEWQDEKTLAIRLSALYIDRFTNKDLPIFKKWLDECVGWGHTDEICSHVTGELLLRYPIIKKDINSWTDSSVMWTRRASILSYIQSVRRERKYFFDIFRNCKKLMHEKDFFIRKVIGWILREMSKKFPEDTIRFVKENEDKLSGLSKREALKNIK